MNEIVIKNKENEIFNFEFEGHQIRSILIDGDPWFVGKDLAEALEYTDPISAMRKLDKDDKISTLGNDSLSSNIFYGNNNKRAYPTLINEPGMYSLIMGSKLQTDNVTRFKKWITHDVLPSIRKHGGYIYGQENMTDDEIMSRALIVANSKLIALEEKNERLKNENVEKTSLMELLQGSKDRYLASEIAQCYGMSAISFNKLLNQFKIQKKVGGVWTLTKQYEGSEEEYMISTFKNMWENKEIVGKRKFNAWTKDGVLFIYKTLKEHGIVPTIENAITVVEG
ncbi:hypothetical protein CWE04_11595 [Thomasclavelia cocleata]|uniref:Prophage antirepressor n=1 Tax=Thomasclavelia cocleata TaxID=69824 RepID=A0A1I0GBM2_9FIRM|nr:BRO family protein [Thomasclavelia cocleata]MCR1959832.1 BRO family protein [Thomasclavelia cocleata]NDO43182.1 hypothetical protein [Thomasclavelia cocleata]PJN79846.1 hypothetical protein CWE04_11595 [Thomasclavelia cocleata]SET68299.1 Prophage antirepressor [Thomasclavelia cocleata]